MKHYKYYIGIDTGKNTGFAVWNKAEKMLEVVETLLIHQAMDKVREFDKNEVLIRVEDARQRKWFGSNASAKQQGAGSIKRDATIWEDFLKDLGYNFEMVAPKNNKTKVSADQFAKMTKWDKRTSEHARDAVMLIFNY
jgi:hypothetical protein